MKNKELDTPVPKHCWHRSYPAGVPFEIHTDGVESLGDLFESCVKKFGGLGAFSCMGTTVTFSEVDRDSKAFGSYLLHELKLVKGDRVALMMPNLLQYPVALFGVLRAGLIAVNVNPLYTPRELHHQLKDSGVKALVILENFAVTLENVIKHFDGLHVVTTQVGDSFSTPKRWMVNTVTKRIKKMVPDFSLPTAVSFREALDKGSKHAFTPVSCVLDDVAFLQYTGGTTTGISKGAMLTHRNVISNIRQMGAWISGTFVSGKEVAIAPLPLYHIFCLIVTLCMMTWGARSVLIPNPRDLKSLIKTLIAEPWTLISGVNTLFNGLLNTPNFDKINFSKVKLCLGGGASIQRSVTAAWLSASGVTITEAYGLTEASPGVSSNPLNAPFKSSIGLPLPSTEMSIRGTHFELLSPWRGGSDLIEPCIGEICIRGPQVMKGYWNRPEDTAFVMRDDWLLTGDLGYMDIHGYFYITDRKKDMVLVSGFNVYPNEIEDVLGACPGVLESAVIGVPDAKTGEAVKAFIVRKNPHLTAEAVLIYCRTRMIRYKLPHHIEFVDSLPKSPIGKILRRELRAPTDQR